MHDLKNLHQVETTNHHNIFLFGIMIIQWTEYYSANIDDKASSISGSSSTWEVLFDILSYI